jgi:hypothetical protein
MHVTSPESLSPTMPTPTRRRTGLIVTLAAVALAAIVAAIIVIATSSGTGSTKGDPMNAVPACREAVKAQLKTPATARFSGERVESGDTQPTIVGAVDAENAFSALVRRSYRCLLHHDASGNWAVSGVSLD